MDLLIPANDDFELSVFEEISLVQRKNWIINGILHGTLALCLVLLLLLFLAFPLDQNVFLKPEKISEHNFSTAIVVLGCLPLDDTTPGLDLTSRVTKGVELWHSTPNAFLILTGGKTSASVSEAEMMSRVALAQNVPSQVILLEENSYSTEENARETATILKGLKEISLILVSRRDHFPRAKLTFERYGFQVKDTISPGLPLASVTEELQTYLKTHKNSLLRNKLYRLLEIQRDK